MTLVTKTPNAKHNKSIFPNIKENKNHFLSICLQKQANQQNTLDKLTERTMRLFFAAWATLTDGAIGEFHFKRGESVKWLGKSNWTPAESTPQILPFLRLARLI